MQAVKFVKQTQDNGNFFVSSDCASGLYGPFSASLKISLLSFVRILLPEIDFSFQYQSHYGRITVTPLKFSFTQSEKPE